MSFEVIVQSFENEDSFWFPSEAVRQRFAKYIKEEKGRIWRLDFDGGGGLSEIYTDPGRLTNGFTVRKPPAAPLFWEIIAGILKDFPCVLFWPGSGAVMGSLNLLPHLPKDFVETFGIPFVSTDPERIRQYVWDNS